MKKYEFSPSKKNIKKTIRSILQVIILLGLIWVIIVNILPLDKYIAYNEDEYTQTDCGFIAVSYFGVDRTSSETLISTKRLEEHLKALKTSGYVTITQEDVLNYYKNKKKLPPKSLFLIFEDGRRDTAIFSQKILEKLNYKATMLTYAQNLMKKDAKFLNSRDLLDIQGSTFWELGTNGYRLEFINVFDRHNNFLDVLNTYEFQRVAQYLDQGYNHYLMDYIRDEYGVPKENLNQMQERIAHDYEGIKDVYSNSLNRIPGMYILMHSNTGQFGTNEKVSKENQKWIYELFEMNFNREGYSLNTKDSSVYDLTRMQPQAYWYTNHLLMRIWDDTKKEVAFVSGDLGKKAYWNMLKGESEFIKDTIVLTSLPRGRGLMGLLNSSDYEDIKLSVNLKGNKVGSQVIYLRADDELDNYISVKLMNNVIYIYEKEKNQMQKELFSLDLNIFDGIVPQSWDENKLEAELEELKTQIKYAKEVGTAKDLSLLLKEKMQMKALSTEDGADEYVPQIGISEPGDRQLEIILTGNKMTMSIDRKPLLENLEVKSQNKGSIYLEASFSGYGYSQRNFADDVYDGVFKNLVIESLQEQGRGTQVVLYDNRLSGIEKVNDRISIKWEAIINWFIKNL